MRNLNVTHWFIFFGLIVIIMIAIKLGGGKRDMICRQCGHMGDSKLVTKGNIAFEIILWLLFIVPGLIYSLWRVSTRHHACRQCGSKEIIPQASPIGKKLTVEQLPAANNAELHIGSKIK